MTKLRRPLIAVIITFIVSFLALSIYSNRCLQGNFKHFFLPAEMFGVPSELKSRGLTELYKGKYQTGWDGQFYYYIANDPLALKDTVQHIDSDAYRYQRIGLPLLANIASKLTGQSWVSPMMYYLTSLFVILVAVGVAANFFQNRNFSPYWILLWSLGCGTQVTQLHGLPDAAADGLLILALVSLVERKSLRYMLTVTFAALAREAYVLLPAFMGLVLLVENVRIEGFGTYSCLRKKGIFRLFKQIWIHVVPIAIFFGWQVFVRIKFGVSPSSQAGGILGWPFTALWHYLLVGLGGMHPVVGGGRAAYLEGFGIILYLSLLMISARALISLLINAWPLGSRFNLEKEASLGIALTFIGLIFMYLCFGPIVMMYYTGYFKVANIFLFVIPLVVCLNRKKVSHLMLVFLMGVTLFFDYFLWVRIFDVPYRPITAVQYVATEPACLKNYRAKITPLSIENTSKAGLISRFLFGRTIVIHVKVTNLSNESFSPFLGKGAVNMAYQWVDAKNLKLVKDGQRTPLTHTLVPNASIVLPVYIEFPRAPGAHLLKLSLVQEGCAWFYLINPESVFTLRY